MRANSPTCRSEPLKTEEQAEGVIDGGRRPLANDGEHSLRPSALLSARSFRRVVFGPTFFGPSFSASSFSAVVFGALF
jgi:hypothetical protein